MRHIPILVGALLAACAGLGPAEHGRAGEDRPAAQPVPAQSEGALVEVLAGTAGPFRLEDRTRVALPLRPGAADHLTSQLRQATPAPRQLLALRGLNATSQPGVVYDIALSVTRPDATVTAERTVGTLNFFSVATRAPGSAPLDETYDVSALLKSLLDGGRLAPQSFTVTITPVGTPKNRPAPTVDRIELVSQASQPGPP